MGKKRGEPQLSVAEVCGTRYRAKFLYFGLSAVSRPVKAASH